MSAVSKVIMGTVRLTHTHTHAHTHTNTHTHTHTHTEALRKHHLPAYVGGKNI